MCQVMAASPCADVRNRSNVGNGYYLDIFYQNVVVSGQNLLTFLTRCVPSISKVYF
jgi:hypothetical protein